MAIADRHFPILFNEKGELDAPEVDYAIRNILLAQYALQEDVAFQGDKLGGAIERGEIAEDGSQDAQIVVTQSTIQSVAPAIAGCAIMLNPQPAKIPFTNGALQLDTGVDAMTYDRVTHSLGIAGLLTVGDTLAVAGAVTLATTLDVTGAVTFGDAVTEEFFFDAGTIHAGRGSIWLGVDPASRTTANYSIGGFGDTQTRINADTTVRFFIDDTVEYASYSSISVEWRFRRRVFMEGQIDTEQLLVRGHSTQTADIFVVDRDDGSDLLQVNDLGAVTLAAYDLGNDVPGRCLIVERNTNAGAEGPAPASFELEAADGVSAFLWVDDDGDLRIHTAKATGSTGTPTVDANTAGSKLSARVIKQFGFTSPGGGSGVFFAAGFYDFPATDANLTQASTTQTLGTANHPYYAHASLVAAAAGTASGGAGAVEIEVSGTSVDDNGVRMAVDTEVIVADITAMATDQYFETTKKWIGQVTYTLQNAGGSTQTTFAADFNYGFAKYEDAQNTDFEITSFEFVGRAGGNDAGFNVELCEHTAVGWTYSAAAFAAGVTPPIVDAAAIWSTESDLINGDHFAFRKLDLSTQISGSGAEGFLVRVTTTTNNAVETMNITVGGRLN
jgi:hypothetical protein